MNHSIWRWEVAGIPFIVVFGLLLHFTFAWSGFWPPVALIAAVNESVWEHLKLAFWPAMAWALIECMRLKIGGWAFWSAKGYGLLVAPLLIVVIFYAYTSLLGRNLLAMDIATFVIAIVLGQIASAKLFATVHQNPTTQVIGIGLLLIQLVAYSTFTYRPPPFALFEDSRTGTRGIPTGSAPVRSDRRASRKVVGALSGQELAFTYPRRSASRAFCFSWIGSVSRIRQRRRDPPQLDLEHASFAAHTWAPSSRQRQQRAGRATQHLLGRAAS